jgi:hypothetical protein
VNRPPIATSATIPASTLSSTSSAARVFSPARFSSPSTARPNTASATSTSTRHTFHDENPDSDNYDDWQ